MYLMEVAFNTPTKVSRGLPRPVGKPQKSTRKETNTLPDGWEVYGDGGGFSFGGKTLYYNRVKQHIQYERPTKPAVTSQDEPDLKSSDDDGPSNVQ